MYMIIILYIHFFSAKHPSEKVNEERQTHVERKRVKEKKNERIGALRACQCRIYMLSNLRECLYEAHIYNGNEQ